MARWPWFEQSFAFDGRAVRFPKLQEHVHGTPARLEERPRNVGEAALSGSDSEGWTIQRNIGHLTVVESLHVLRLEQILAGEATLVAADLTNRATSEGGFHAGPGAALLRPLRTAREAAVARFGGVTEVERGRPGCIRDRSGRCGWWRSGAARASTTMSIRPALPDGTAL